MESSDLSGSRVVTDYYFIKNGKYYDVAFEDHRMNTNNDKMIEDATNMIIATLN